MAAQATQYDRDDALTHLNLKDDEVPRGTIEQGPYAARRRRFGVAVPYLGILFAVVGISALLAIPIARAGLFDWMPYDGSVVAPLLIMASALGGATASTYGWPKNRRVGPMRPLLTGLGVSLVISLSALGVMSLAALS